MPSDMNKKKLPVRLITGSFQNTLNDSEQSELDNWLASEGNRSLYSELYAYWKSMQNDLSSYDPDGKRLWVKFMQKTRPAHRKRRLFMGAAAAAVLLVGLVSLYFIPSGHVPETVTVAAVSGKSKTVLPDGSTVWVNRGASLEYDAGAFGKGARPVVLAGEAYFKVAEDKKKVFSVSVDGLLIKVTGTEFNVKETASKVEVSLAEGSVELSGPSGQSISLTKGQKAEYDKSAGALSRVQSDVGCDICWARGSLTFKAKTLGEICRYLSVWYGVRIVPVSTLADEYAYTFTVTDEPLEEILMIMGKINPIAYEKTSDGYSITELRQ